jgi:monoamine oxidase
MSRSLEQGRETVDVAIVGAGVSGLTCARALVAGGVSVKVVEARDRVGGRTLSLPIGGAVFDLGGQWLGARQKRLAGLAAELGVETFPQYARGQKMLEVGGRISRYSGTIPKLAPWKLIELHLALRGLGRLARAVSPSDPLAAPRAREWDARSLDDWTRSAVRSETVRQVLATAVRVIFGAEPGDLSLLFFLYYMRSGGSLMDLVQIEDGAQERRFVGGVQQISQRLAAALGDGVVRLGAPVRSIEQGPDGVIVHADGAEVGARYAVVAVPPALAGRIDYRPALPVERDQLTQRFPMGSTVKCLALYERAFWREAGLSGEAVCGVGPVSVVFDATSHDGRVPALLAFVVGDAARGWSSRGEAERRDAVLSVFTRLFGSAAAAPVHYVEQDWSTEPWTRGCPTGAAVPGAFASLCPALRRPVGRLHWAGTETATEWCGYIEGALESGERAAREVLARL